MDLATRFDDSWRQLGATSAAGEVWSLIAEGYSEPHRHYHTLAHLRHCVRELDVVATHARRPAELEQAIYFHDLVYQPARTDNEELSAARAQDLLRAGRVSADVIERIAQLILSTKTHGSDLVGDAALLSDIDLAILGADADRYCEYEAEVRREYQFVPDETFWFHRRRFARSMLDRERIFHTRELGQLYEGQARVNLAASAAHGV